MGILLVDDSTLTLLFLEDVLKKSGYRDVFLAESMDVASQILNGPGKGKVQLAIVDLFMPGVDGLEACRRLRNAEPGREIPVLLMSCASDDESVEKAKEAGAVGFLNKPMTKKELVGAVKGVIGGPPAKK